MGYVSYSEGFNSGGVATPTIRRARLILPYKPQTLKNTEIGIRSDLADGRLRFNATLFHTIWTDLQATGVVYDPRHGSPDADDRHRRTSARRRRKARSSSSLILPIESMRSI